jgi:anti-sigma regulatory factor (Ser/Thr protein kinase)
MARIVQRPRSPEVTRYSRDKTGQCRDKPWTHRTNRYPVCLRTATLRAVNSDIRRPSAAPAAAAGASAPAPAPVPPVGTEPTVRTFLLQLSATPRGARLARLLAVEQLRTWGRGTDTAGQIIAELTANAVTHGRVAGRDFRLRVSDLGEVVRIEVADTRGDRVPVLRTGTGGDEEESGRGLLLVELLAARWGVSSGPAPGKTVWAELDVPPMYWAG